MCGGPVRQRKDMRRGETREAAWKRAARYQHGVLHPVMAFVDHYTGFRGLCRDRESATHTAVFTRVYDGTAMFLRCRRRFKDGREHRCWSSRSWRCRGARCAAPST